MMAGTGAFPIRIPFPRLTFIGPSSRIATDDATLVWRLTGSEDRAPVIFILLLSPWLTSHDPFG